MSEYYFGFPKIF